MTDRSPRPDYLHWTRKEPGYRYRWLNERDRNLLIARYEGWEPVLETAEDALLPAPAGIASTVGQVVRRGDLVLHRVKEDTWQEREGAREREMRERHALTIDTMVKQANENAMRMAANHGVKVPVDRPLVFVESSQ